MGGSSKNLVPFRQLFRYASSCDRLCIGIAIISAAISGACIPICNIFTGKIAALLTSIDGQWECNRTSSRPQFVKGTLNRKIFESRLFNLSLLLAISGVVQLVFAYVATWLFCHVAEKQTYRLRINYLRALLRQDIGWYDTTSDSSFLTRMAEDVRKIQEAIGVKLCLFIYYGNNSLICLGIALFHGWVLVLVALTAFPISILIALVFHAIVTRFAVKTQAQFSKSGSIVQQTVTNIKTVMAFNGQGKQAAKYSSALAAIRGVQSKQAVITGIGLGLSHGLKHCSYALAIWYAATLYFDEVSKICKTEPTYGVSTLMIISFCVLDFQQNLTNCLALVETFSNGRGAASGIFAVIDRKPRIDSMSAGGIRTGGQLRGRVEFRDVHFSYPARSQAKILQGLNLVVEPGKTVALVGASGCGKSTCLQLLQRFYDPTAGTIYVDGTDIKGYNLQWYRSQLAVVTQEPSLFNGTIGENILYGNPEASTEELQDVMVRSGVQSFVSELPDKYDTLVGDRGAQLSGGQKQRIAICRAMLQSPSILLLDEVTSALDVASEAAVTAAINEMKRGRTTLIIAHRISTLKSADTIALIQDGRIVLQESPEELRKRTDLYIGRLLKDSSGDTGSVHSLTNTYGQFENSAGDESLQHFPMTLETTKQEEEEKVRKNSSTKAILSLAFRERKERALLLVGLFMCAAQGVVQPLMGFIFGQSLQGFSKDNPQDGKELVAGFAIMFVYLGIITFTTNSFSVALFGCAGASLTTRLRNLSFAAILRQRVSWFQMPENNVGAVCSRLARDVASVQEATGTHLGLFLSAASSILVSIVLCFSLHWKLAFAGWAFSPLLMIGAYLNGKMVAAQEGAENDAHAKASNLAFQAISNIRPVTTLCLQEYFVSKFTDELSKTHRSAKRRAHLLGLVFGISQALSHFAFAVVLYYGGTFVRDGTVGYPTVFTIGEALVWTMLDVGRTLAYLPNVTRAKMAAHRILTLLRSNSDEDLDRGGGMDIYSCKGKLGFEDVTFTYPTRRNMAALRGVSWDLPANGHIGICGPSGSGKSTTIELLLRFYDPDSGRILLDQLDMKSLKLESLRAKIAIVSQEPVLFDDAIVENIAYGLESGPRRLEVVIKAAEMANIHEFIMSLPNGYSTRLGGLGTQLSGGQKQRIAIARALARTPRILILDEATSALDAESEKSVQTALEKSREGRTCVSVAHKLECIQSADRIIVMAKGRVVQMGTHEELLSQTGLYAYLWSLQSAQLT